MQETVESVKKYGILMPGIVRPHPDHGYEVIAGHRRWRACELAGVNEMPVIIRDMDDDAAIVIMVDMNIQREDILPSEKAHAYKMKYEAMKHQGSRGDKYTADEVGEAAGESGRTVQRYIRLAELLKAKSETGALSESQIYKLLAKAENKKVHVTISAKKISSYFSVDYSKEQIEEVIYTLLEEWKQREE